MKLDSSTLRDRLPPHDSLQVYNGLDCAVTLEVLGELKPMLGGTNQGDPNFDPVEAFTDWDKFKPEQRATVISSARQLMYNFERGLQGPVLEMMLRGWRIDLFHRDAAVSLLRKQDTKVQSILDKFATAIWGRGLNPNSPKQLKEFFYSVMKLPEQFRFDRGERKVTTNRDALEKLYLYLYARPFINCILKLRDIRKKISVLTTEVDNDKRLRTSYNITGTETARFSSSANAWGGGTNIQNITEELRRCFIADPGYKLAYVDLEQAESRALGFIILALFGDASYIEACETGDLHTAVCKLVWPNLPWTGDLKQDRDLAEQLFYRHFSYRDLAKRGGHGTNYYGTPPTMARHLHVIQSIIESFRDNYFGAFPGIPRYHRWCAQRLQTSQYLLTPLGMGRHFFGRPHDDATLREVIAFLPQSIVAKMLNLAMWRIWKYERRAQLLAQIHDAVVIQYKEEEESDVLASVLRLMPTPLTHNARTVVIPAEASVGWNWQKRKVKVLPDGSSKIENPDGLAKWKGHDERKRTESPSDNGLDRRLP